LILLTPSLSLLSVGYAGAATPNLSVSGQTLAGSSLNGYWVEVQDSSGAVVQTGFTPAHLTLAPGSYTVSVGDYGGQYFAHWTDGTPSRSHSITIGVAGNVSLDAVYCPSQGCGGSSISVRSTYSNGTTLTGMYTTVSQNGAIVGSGFTSASFPTTTGLSYQVTVSDYKNSFFNHWSNGYSVRTITLTANATRTPLDAIYTSTAQGPPPSNQSITVTSNDLNGTALAGFFVDLRVNGNHVASGFTPVTFQNLQKGVQYGVVVYWFGDYYFRHFSNGNLNRYDLVTLNATAGQTSESLDALYQSIPSGQVAHLNIQAEFPNGTLIGTSEFLNGYPSHTPGMWVTVAPPGSYVPYTGSYTGGSILPFSLVNGQTYTVQMIDGYGKIQFSHWLDTGSTNPIRPIALHGDAGYIAVYVVAP
jgi:hypothetical protein